MYVELYVYLVYSFFDGVSMFEELVEEVVWLGLCVLVLIDYDGLYGVVWFVEVVVEFDVCMVFGVELLLGVMVCIEWLDLFGLYLLVLVCGLEGYWWLLW